MSGWHERASVLSSGNLPAWHLVAMLGALIRLLLYRFLGARLMLALAAFGWLRRVLGGSRRRNEPRRLGRRPPGERRTGSPYQPSQGESQIVQREPR